MKEKCIHYIACDSKKYCIEAEISALNFKEHCTDTHFILYTDVEFSSSVFDEIVKIPNLIPNGNCIPGWSEGKLYFETKIELLSNTKFEKNLYLDGDIKTLVDIDCMFSMLDKFSIIVAHDSCRTTKWSDVFGIPLCFPDLNCGLIFYKKSDTGTFFKEWARNFSIQPQPHDQPSFRKTLWDCNLRFSILPPEFNLRPSKFHYYQDVAIIHGRGKGFLPLIDELVKPKFL
ncbi:MAG: hypothetical protein EKK64_06155 [Neisseriaceae bacterium]|nr:MAG: hypothetical protein EKK64_06155 [Neisseriaceae bacterium]